MLLNQDPVILYGPNGQVKSIPTVDAPGWLAQGWSLEQSNGDKGGEEENLSPIPDPQSPTPSPSGTTPKRKRIVAENDGNTLPEN
ncbi:MAG: hypothetical protein KME52_24940 [Desmonostoc geniculatum HA4340-LM1]|nr:hypothetical protein [Desmonostoc geniculatum HA4340-LM1]